MKLTKEDFEPFPGMVLNRFEWTGPMILESLPNERPQALPLSAYEKLIKPQGPQRIEAQMNVYLIANNSRVALSGSPALTCSIRFTPANRLELANYCTNYFFSSHQMYGSRTPPFNRSPCLRVLYRKRKSLLCLFRKFAAFDRCAMRFLRVFVVSAQRNLTFAIGRVYGGLKIPLLMGSPSDGSPEILTETLVGHHLMALRKAICAISTSSIWLLDMIFCSCSGTGQPNGKTTAVRDNIGLSSIAWASWKLCRFVTDAPFMHAKFDLSASDLSY